MSALITFEGGDGSGKSTQAELLRRHLTEQGHSVLLVAEPGGTPLGDAVARLVKGKSISKRQALSPVAELFLFLAARSQLVTGVIQPALSQAGAVVICDRYMDSSTAYQGYGRRLGAELVQSANDVAVGAYIPDLTFLMDLPPSEAGARAAARASREADAGGGGGHTEGMRRFEDEEADFHERVHDGYIDMAASEPDRWRRIDAGRTEEEIAEEVSRIAEEVVAELVPVDIGAGSGGGEQQRLF